MSASASSFDAASIFSTQGDMDMPSVLSGLSVFMWGMVLSKARSGLAAASSKDTSEVAGQLKKSGALILMITAASIFKYLSVQKQDEPA